MLLPNILVMAFSLLAAGPTDLSDLPLIEVPQKDVSTDMMGVLLSGDGGWWSLDRTVAETFARHGVPMVGISSYKYFKATRTPESVAEDVARILRFYLDKWHKEKVVLIGYSLGAEIMPFAANRLPEDLHKRVVFIGLIGPSATTTFAFNITDWIRPSPTAKKYPVLPEIEKLKGVKVLCLGSEQDKDCICSKLDQKRVKSITLPGNHHFNDKFALVGETIWKEVPGTAEAVR